jgi:hypothetical protein
MVWFGGSSAPVVIGAAALTIVALFRAVLQMRLADPLVLAEGLASGGPRERDPPVSRLHDLAFST